MSNRFPASCACRTTSTRTKSSGQDDHRMFTSHKWPWEPTPRNCTHSSPWWPCLCRAFQVPAIIVGFSIFSWSIKYANPKSPRWASKLASDNTLLDLMSLCRTHCCQSLCRCANAAVILYGYYIARPSWEPSRLMSWQRDCTWLQILVLHYHWRSICQSFCLVYSRKQATIPALFRCTILATARDFHDESHWSWNRGTLQSTSEPAWP